MKLSTVCFLFVLVCSLTITIYLSIKTGLDMKEKKYKRRCHEIIEKLRDIKKIDDDVFINFPKYYINLDRSVERREKMEKELVTYGIKNVERIRACDGKKLEDVDQGDFGDIQFTNQLKKLTKSEIAITCSHLKSIKRARDRNLKGVIIMEDDTSFELVPHWKVKFETLLKSIPNNADVVLLTCWGDKSENNLFNTRKGQTAAVCYLVTRKGMDRVVRDFFKDGKLFFSEKSGLENAIIDTGIWSYLDTYYVHPRMFPLESLVSSSTHYKGFHQSIFSENHKILKHYYDENQKE